MLTLRIDVDPLAARAASALLDARVEKTMLVASDRAANRLVGRIRREMQAAGLGRLGNAIGSSSDQSKKRGVHRGSGGRISASGTVFIRSASERSRGAIISYTEGAQIRPIRSRYLWFPTDDFQRVANIGAGKGKYRLEPGLWRASGLEAKFGPLVRIFSKKGNPLLVVRNASVSASGKARSAKPLTKKGKLRKGQVAKDVIVAFVGIPRTSRAARIDPLAMAQEEARTMISDIAAAFDSGSAFA